MRAAHAAWKPTCSAGGYECLMLTALEWAQNIKDYKKQREKISAAHPFDYDSFGRYFIFIYNLHETVYAVNATWKSLKKRNITSIFMLNKWSK